jgi:hypothetical protein
MVVVIEETDNLKSEIIVSEMHLAKSSYSQFETNASLSSKNTVTPHVKVSGHRGAVTYFYGSSAHVLG